MNFLKNLLGRSSDEETKHLKARLKKAENILTRLSEDECAKISVDLSLDIWEFLHAEEIEKE